MKISIITVCYNAEKTIERTILSVISQTHPTIEYIVVDGNSNDQTINIIQKYKTNITKIISEPDRGIYDAINKGINLASGDIVGLLHADDVFAYPHAIEDINNCFEKSNKDSLYADLQYMNGTKVFRHWVSGKFEISKFKWGWMPPHPTFYCRKSCFELFGKYNTNYKISSDYELMLRYLYKNKISVSYLPKVLVQMQIGGKSNATIQNRMQANLEDNNAWKENNLKPYLFTFWLKPIRKIFQYVAPYLT